MADRKVITEFDELDDILNTAYYVDRECYFEQAWLNKET
jgi:hypothetical protein